MSALRSTYLGFMTRSVVSFFVGIILARILGPKPFGQLAAASLVFGLANQVADAGFGSALVQAKELREVQIRFAFTIQLLIGLTMTIAVICFAPYVALLFHDPALPGIMRIIAPLFVLQAFGQTSTGLLKRKLWFSKIQKAQVSSSILGFLIVGVPAAFCGAGVWSLVAAQLVQSLSYSAQVYASVRHSALPTLSGPGLSLLRFGTAITACNIVNWSITNLDNTVVGRVFGSTSLGLYSRAFDLANVPAAGIVSTCQQVLFASCCRAGGRLDTMRRAYLSCLSAVAIIILPMFWSMAACSSTIVLGVCGPKWAAAAPLFRPFALAVTLHALMALAGPILGAANYVKRELRAQIVSLFFAALVFGVLVRYSATAVAWGVLFAYGIRFCVATLPTLRLLALGWIDVFRVLGGPVAMATVTAGVAFATDCLGTHYAVQPAWRLALLTVVGASTVFLMLGVFGHRLLASQLVSFLTPATVTLPRVLAQRLEHIAKKQALRSDLLKSKCAPQSIVAWEG